MTTLDPFSTALEWAAAIRSLEASPTEALDLYLQRIAHFDSLLNTHSLIAEEEAKATAAAMTKQMTRANQELPPFFGLPMPIKGLNAVTGWPNRRGSLAVPNTLVLRTTRPSLDSGVPGSTSPV